MPDMHSESELSHKPRIGIVFSDSGTVASETSNKAAVKMVEQAGGIVVRLNHPPYTHPAMDIQKVDGIIVLGRKFDINPVDYGAAHHPNTWVRDSNRTEYEKELAICALEQKTPMLMICAGMHRLNVVTGGTLYQHIPAMMKGNNAHVNNAGHDRDVAAMPVKILPDTRLAEISRRSTDNKNNLSQRINSFHHQAVKDVGNGLRVSALSTDKTHIIEALEEDPAGKYGTQYILGVGWHPEYMEDNALSKMIFVDLTAAALKFASEKDKSSFTDRLEIKEKQSPQR